MNAGTTGKRSVGCMVGGESCSSVFFLVYIYMAYTIISYLNLPVQEIVASFRPFLMYCIHLFIYICVFFVFPCLVTICIAIPFKQHVL